MQNLYFYLFLFCFCWKTWLFLWASSKKHFIKSIRSPWDSTGTLRHNRTFLRNVVHYHKSTSLIQSAEGSTTQELKNEITHFSLTWPKQLTSFGHFSPRVIFVDGQCVHTAGVSSKTRGSHKRSCHPWFGSKCEKSVPKSSAVAFSEKLSTLSIFERQLVYS